MKKRILCYGDSNTYGYMPGGGRYSEEVRWPMRLQRLLGDDYMIVEEGFGGRTTVFDDPVEGGFKSGQAYLPPCLMSHNPLDLVILMLGTNDTKQRFQSSANLIANCNKILIDTIRRYGEDADAKPPKILLVAPIRIGEQILETDMATAFGTYAIDVAAGFGPAFEAAAKECDCAFLDAAKIAKPSLQDAVHLTPEGHRALAEAICARVKEIL